MSQASVMRTKIRIHIVIRFRFYGSGIGQGWVRDGPGVGHGWVRRGSCVGHASVRSWVVLSVRRGSGVGQGWVRAG